MEQAGEKLRNALLEHFGHGEFDVDILGGEVCIHLYSEQDVDGFADAINSLLGPDTTPVINRQAQN